MHALQNDFAEKDFRLKNYPLIKIAGKPAQLHGC
jgi:hypothetical protein